jgi:hypothetical protein
LFRIDIQKKELQERQKESLTAGDEDNDLVII